MAIGINVTKTNNQKFALELNSYILKFDVSDFDSSSTTAAKTLTVTTPSDGKLYTYVKNPNIAAASITDKSITVIPRCHGYTVLTVAQDTGTAEYTMATPETTQCLIHVTVPSLEDTSWDRISTIAQAGDGPLYWDVGDTKTVTLNGNVGDYLSLDNYQCKVFILHFNLPDDKTIPQKNIIFGGFKKINTNEDMFLADAKYWKQAPNEKAFGIIHYDSYSLTCWSGTELRYDILGAVETPPPNYGTNWWPDDLESEQDYDPREGSDATTAAITNPVANTLMAALPAEFRTVLRLWNRYLDKCGKVYYTQKSETSRTPNRHWETAQEDITKMVDAGISLLSEFEVLGSCVSANPYEQYHQTYLDYYAQGGSISKTYHDFLTDKAEARNHLAWWLASLPYDTFPSGFLAIYNQKSESRLLTESIGIAPAFKV